jgi:Zn-dependent peptidase ImmA (M78 family)
MIKKVQQLLIDFKITTAPALSINQIFERNGIIYDEMDYDNTYYMGSLIRAEGKVIILVNTDIKNIGRINFTKAHELGHFILNHKGEGFECFQSDLSNSTRKPLEIEANQFAVEFLLPEKMVKSILLTAPFDFETIHSISNDYLVSNIVALFRILDFHRGNYAFMGSKDGKITYSKLSNSLAGKIYLRRSGSDLDSKSFANTCLSSNLLMKDYSNINPNVWISKNRTESKISLKELSRADKLSRTTMTLLKVDFL